MATNKGKTPYELIYEMKLDVGHICTFGCVAKAVETEDRPASYDWSSVEGQE